MITKITRRQLRQLINEALKPFFMGVPPSSITSQLLKDPRVPDAAKELLSHPDPEIQRTGMTLIQDPDILATYPELDNVDIAIPELMPDLTDRSQPAYRKAFKSGQQRAEDLATRQKIAAMGSFEKMDLVREIAESIYTTVFSEEAVGNPPNTKTLILRGDHPQAFGPGVKKLDKAETERFMSRIQNIGLRDAVYIQQPHQIIFVFDD